MATVACASGTGVTHAGLGKSGAGRFAENARIAWSPVMLLCLALVPYRKPSGFLSKDSPICLAAFKLLRFDPETLETPIRFWHRIGT